ncbi:MAG: GH1 family beta-glucosidase [Deinococcota bacterium]
MSTFPADFTWGVATSAYQIEGATETDGRGASIWDTFSATPGKTHGGHSGKVACNHYELWQQDLDLIRNLGVQAYRFSIAWPRIYPQGRGQLNPKGLDFYDQVVDGLLARNIEPHVTLYHWDLPQALEDKDGWLNRDIVPTFVDYAHTITERLGDRVTSFATLNEPWCSSFLGYGIGVHAPGIQDKASFLQAAHHLLLAHGEAIPVMRETAPNAQHGIVLNFEPAYPATDKEEDTLAAARYEGFYFKWYLEPLLKGSYPDDMLELYDDNLPDIQSADMARMAAPLDFLGINMYTRAVVTSDPSADLQFRQVRIDEVPRTAMDWEIYPEGLEQLLVNLHNDYELPPLFITENGAAFDDILRDGEVNDNVRIDYLERHLEAVSNAIQQGVDIRGYFAWSLMDNFEWAFGYDKRFGIVHVDYDTQTRTLKNSAKWYTEMIQQQRSSAA